MKLAAASDHAGFTLKQAVVRYLQSLGHEVTDLGCHSTESVDYPDYAVSVARLVSEQKVERGILICGTGIGMCMVACKFPGVRAAVLRSYDDARLSRLHNDANIACLGGRVSAEEQAKTLLDTFLGTPFEEGRHQRRLEKIRKLEKS